ncbi:MAG: hypothetical protein IT422_15205 [Pirellulaceae bacterium]|nr:hypothetical protein [Pirellulaceae bacterium]
MKIANGDITFRIDPFSARYMFARSLSRVSLLVPASILCGLIGMTLAGCQPTDVKAPTDEVSDTPVVASKIPLRVWIVAPLTEPDLLQRQWLASSEQPLELRSLTALELLQESQCQCDVLIYPANLMGELIERSWIVKLPSGVLQENDSGSGDTEHSTTPATWLAQAAYGGEVKGLSLGCSVPVFVASNALAESHSAGSWESLLAQLQIEANESPQFSFEAADVSPDALVDRFFAIVASLSDRDPGYGMLFDLQSMQARLTDPEYRRAAGIMAALASQPKGLASILGSHSLAWTWAASHETPALAIAAPTLLDKPAAALATGGIVSIKWDSAERESTSPSADALAERPQIAWWSTGAGLVASQSSQCRQTNQANACLRWLVDPAMRGVLATLLPGVEAGAPKGSGEALSWIAEQGLAQSITVKGLSLEPRLPSTHLYRQTLADELQQFLSGKKNAEQALQAAAQRWDEITRNIGSAQRRNYEKSLNL